MVFSSLLFLIVFLPACLICHGLAGRLDAQRLRGEGGAEEETPAAGACAARNAVLLVFSLFFYAWGEPRCVPLLVLSALVDYLDGLALSRFEGRPGLRRLALIIALGINFSLLGLFKYADFLVGSLNCLPGLHLPLPGIALPIGISFYTFQTTSYSIDVYRGRVAPERSFLRYLTYVSLFPQLIAGPIVRYETVGRELVQRETGFSREGFWRFLIGLFRKVLIANDLGALWAELSARGTSAGGGGMSVAAAWLGLITFTLQLYYDFSAYSDMAIGLGRMLGFRFEENFRYPLAADSITEFWRRWHISLSSWFRDYVYIPLGGNRRGRLVQLRNLLVVWALTGLWHGASWNYVLWGLYHCFFLVLEKFVLGRAFRRLPVSLRHLYAVLVVILGFGIFYFEDLGALGAYLAVAFGMTGGPWAGYDLLWAVRNHLPALCAGALLAFPLYPEIMGCLARRGRAVRAAAAALGGAAAVGLFVLCLAELVRDSYNPFLYFRF